MSKTAPQSDHLAQAGTSLAENPGGVTEYTTIRATVEVEQEISRSRFLTKLVRVETEDAAREVISQVRAQHPKARHHCSAFVLGPDARIQRSNDDGEPSGTAGAPMLDALTAAELTDVVAVVTRYFGGILLGAGGLTRAYRGAVAAATAKAKRQSRALLTPVWITAAYDTAPILEAEARRRGFCLGRAIYGEAVEQEYLLRREEIAACEALAAEVSAGTAEIQHKASAFYDLPVSL